MKNALRLSWKDIQKNIFLLIVVYIEIVLILSFMFVLSGYFFEWFNQKELYSNLSPHEITQLEIFSDETQPLPDEDKQNLLKQYRYFLDDNAYLFLEGGELEAANEKYPILYVFGQAGELFDLTDDSPNFPSDEYVILGSQIEEIEVNEKINFPSTSSTSSADSIPVIDKLSENKTIILNNQRTGTENVILLFSSLEQLQERVGMDFLLNLIPMQMNSNFRFLNLSEADRYRLLSEIESDTLRVKITDDSHVSSVMDSYNHSIHFSFYSFLGLLFVIVGFIVLFEAWLKKYKKDFLIHWLYGASSFSIWLRIVNTIFIIFGPPILLSWLNFQNRFNGMNTISFWELLICLGVVVLLASLWLFKKLDFSENLFDLRGD